MMRVSCSTRSSIYVCYTSVLNYEIVEFRSLSLKEVEIECKKTRTREMKSKMPQSGLERWCDTLSDDLQ